MSDVEIRVLYRGKFARAEAELRRPLSRPVRFQYGTTGWYFSVEEAQQISDELREAVLAAKVGV